MNTLELLFASISKLAECNERSEALAREIQSIFGKEGFFADFDIDFTTLRHVDGCTVNGDKLMSKNNTVLGKIATYYAYTVTHEHDSRYRGKVYFKTDIEGRYVEGVFTALRYNKNEGLTR